MCTKWDDTKGEKLPSVNNSPMKLHLDLHFGMIEPIYHAMKIAVHTISAAVYQINITALSPQKRIGRILPP